MKNLRILFVTMLALGISALSFGQTGKGKFLIGTGSNLSFISGSSKWKTDTGSGDNGISSALGLSPKLGYFVTDELALGVELQLGYGKSKNNSDKSHSFDYGVGPFARYYFGSDKLKPFVGGALNLGGDSQNSTISNTTYKSKSSTFSFDLGGGLAYFLSEKVSLDLGINYNYKTAHLNTPDNYRDQSGTLIVGAGFNFFIW